MSASSGVENSSSKAVIVGDRTRAIARCLAHPLPKAQHPNLINPAQRPFTDRGAIVVGPEAGERLNSVDVEVLNWTIAKSGGHPQHAF